VPDVNGLETLDVERLKATWAADVDRIANHYGFDKEQRDKAAEELRRNSEFSDIWSTDAEVKEKRLKYYNDLRNVQAIEHKKGALSYELERAAARRKELDYDRKELTAPVVAKGKELHDAVVKLATPDQQQARGPYVAPMTKLDQVNLTTTYGLIAMGVCLILGLLGPFAALAGAVFLGQIYLSMPPWPGLPANPMAEGHYFIVNKNLIEMLACLALVFIPTSFWIGFDSLLFGRMFRRRELVDDAPRSNAGVSSTGTGRSIPADKNPIPLSSPVRSSHRE